MSWTPEGPEVGSKGSFVHHGSGKLHLEIDMEYATVVRWNDTYTVAGSSQPLLTAEFDEVRLAAGCRFWSDYDRAKAVFVLRCSVLVFRSRVCEMTAAHSSRSG